MITIDYVMKTLPIEILFIPLLCVIIYEATLHYIVKKRFSTGNKRIAILFLILTIGVVLIIPCMQMLKFGVFLPFEDYSVSNTSGYIQNITSAGRFIRNSYDESNELRRAYIICINDTDYLYFGAEPPATDDYIDFSFYRLCNVVCDVNLDDTPSELAANSYLVSLPSQELTMLIKYRNVEYYSFILLTLINIGTALFTKKRTDRECSNDGRVIYGELLFAGGAIIGIAMFAAIFIIHCLFPDCWLMQIPFFYLILPSAAVTIIGQARVTCIISGDKAEIKLLNFIPVRVISLSNIVNVTFIISKWGGLVIFSFEESNALQYDSLFSLLIYLLINRRKYILAIQNNSIECFSTSMSDRIRYTDFVLQDIFKDKYIGKQELFSTF